MRNRIANSVFGLLAMSALASVMLAQDTPSTGSVTQHAPSVFGKMNTNSGGPAPVHDMSGSWAGPLEPQMGDVPPMTPAGQAKFKLNIPDPFSASSNDPWKTCDPFGFPRSATNETRGLTFGEMPGRILILTQYEKIWREA